MSKFAIDPGHGDVNGSLGGDGGAVGYLVEQDCALDIGNRVISKLKSLGYEAWNVRPSTASNVTDSLQRRCDGAVSADYLVSIHLNAGGGKGSEVFAMSSSGNTLASSVLSSLVSLGFVNRGVKDGSGLYVIKHSKPVAILIEVCFVDTKSDADLYNQLGSETIANAVVQGLTGRQVSDSNMNPDFIKSVQHDLQRVSCLQAGENNVTGKLDDKTKQAITQFRYIVDLPSGNSIDDALVNALNTIVNKPTIGAGWPSNPIPTKFIKWYIGITPKNELWDSNTVQKVKEWQVKAGIWSAQGADGVIREKDWNKILK
ncbi:cell wall hydrolase [Clostridium carboxidivorans P7]|uniref:Cell wall hydrolase/autolysin n=1 Tax=Clostridium carboxidivorans P7 TaxID=536227 RepID=C6PUT9_9CLOT|nr:N-acetylmuramoyl-L-alanine amidase [Clostridium carboxidivorans]AKN29322.1 cell wall hydrolase [Clostridium carboxidivorans P7]EET87018.1 cell wall hydrolase/autolysin [Clostridium carboxidivorans P7]EFG89767.1 N-acetylmuramoyl-L-alanine amidase [Clostridium carboxidivorans P7]